MQSQRHNTHAYMSLWGASLIAAAACCTARSRARVRPAEPASLLKLLCSNRYVSAAPQQHRMTLSWLYPHALFRRGDPPTHLYASWLTGIHSHCRMLLTKPVMPPPAPPWKKMAARYRSSLQAHSTAPAAVWFGRTNTSRRLKTCAVAWKCFAPAGPQLIEGELGY
jgi:hypothetical protein